MTKGELILCIFVIIFMLAIVGLTIRAVEYRPVKSSIDFTITKAESTRSLVV